jgi:ubiquinone/menaquinone biosynthesis C-methylase UbiE
MGDANIEYYQWRANEYDATSWEHPGADARDTERIRVLLNSLPAVRTLDIGCGTGYLSRWLPRQLTLVDASLAMLSIATHRLPRTNLVRAKAPQLPLMDSSFGPAFTANLYGHLAPSARELVREMLRVAPEFVVVDQLANSDTFSEGPRGWK